MIQKRMEKALHKVQKKREKAPSLKTTKMPKLFIFI